METAQLVDAYRRLRDAREKKLRDFFFSSHPAFLIIQRPPFEVYSHCNTIEDICYHNRIYIERWVRIEATDELPYMEPWMGTGVFASMFGGVYHWREGDSPHIDYLLHSLDELEGISEPDWRKNEIAHRVLATIDALKEMTDGGIPIAWTDTQSPYDTGTLVLDAAEFFAGCYEEPEFVERFLRICTDLVIEFSRVQAERIGADLLAKPGHLFPGAPTLRGIAVSDDNLAVGSPDVNERFSLPCDNRIGEAFDGIAIHSCGVWTHTMPLLRKYPHIRMIDCAIGLPADPNPNRPEEVREAMAYSGIILKVRPGSADAAALEAIRAVAHPSMRLIVEIPYEEGAEKKNYDAVRAILEEVYAQ